MYVHSSEQYHYVCEWKAVWSHLYFGSSILFTSWGITVKGEKKGKTTQYVMQASVCAQSGPVPKACPEKIRFLLWNKIIQNHLQDWINLKFCISFSKKKKQPPSFLPFVFPSSFPFFFIAWCIIIRIDNYLHISCHFSSLSIILVCVHTNRKGLFYHCFASVLTRSIWAMLPYA